MKKQKGISWKATFFMILLMSVLTFFALKDLQKTSKQTCEDGVPVTMYSELDYGVTVYYYSCVKYIGVSHSQLVKICDTEEVCRKPYKQEVEEDRFIPQSQIE